VIRPKNVFTFLLIADTKRQYPTKTFPTEAIMDSTLCPKARTEDLVVSDTEDETLVYDLVRNKAHCLNETAGFVWKRCDGNTSIKEIARAMEEEYRHPVDIELVTLAIKQLDDGKLLKTSGIDLLDLPNRRQMLKKIGLSSAVALPVVASLAVPRTVWAQASCFCSNVPPVTICNTLAGCPSICQGFGAPEMFACVP